VIEKRRAQGVRNDDHDILAFMLRECGKEGKEWVDDHEIMMQTITFLLAGAWQDTFDPLSTDLAANHDMHHHTQLNFQRA
jgi:hypothetical protein